MNLRAVVASDLDIFFEFFQDDGAIDMAAFTPEDPSDRKVFDAHWDRILGNETVTMMTIEVDGEVAGNVGSFSMEGDRDVTYWVGRSHWGSGVATAALKSFLLIDTTRPINARVVQDNAASIRVLEKCGFTVSSTDEGFAPGRGKVVAEYIMTLDP
jgi:RimJ/RimL family protein N-acetyltransferase